VLNQILQGDAKTILQTLPDGQYQTCVTSPPYWGLRDYGVNGQLGLEDTPERYVQNMVDVFREVKRVLRDDGTLWLNLGDSYAGSGKGAGNYPGDYPKQNSNKGSLGIKGLPVVTPEGLKPKDLVGIPWMVAFALRADGWYLRSDIIWSKPNPMPESVKDRPTKSHEYIFLFSKSDKYYYEREAIMEPLAESSIARISQDLEGQKGSERANGGAKTNGNMKAVFTPRGSKGVIKNPLNTGLRDDDSDFTPPDKRNKRTVWTVTTKPYKEAHFATFPPDLIEPCILAGCPEGGRVLDPFFGSGTTGQVAMKNNRNFTGIELNSKYIDIAKKRLSNVQPVFNFHSSEVT
jgi:DNA modification methylase